MAIWHQLQQFTHLQAQGRRKENEHAAYIPLRGMTHFTVFINQRPWKGHDTTLKGIFIQHINIFSAFSGFRAFLINILDYNSPEKKIIHIYYFSSMYYFQKGKGSPYSITEHRVTELIRFLAINQQVTWIINLAVGCHCFSPGLQLPSQPSRWLLPISLLGEQRHKGCEVCLRLLPDSVTYAIWTQALPCLSPAHTRLPSHPMYYFTKAKFLVLLLVFRLTVDHLLLSWTYSIHVAIKYHMTNRKSSIWFAIVKWFSQTAKSQKQKNESSNILY